ncbi:sensor histidine kinase [Olivibacter domesticus]|uniref:histidine kinase n=1 Tax=Olivibacter domesticus TaxID=407022 RepID=A0A1H7S3D8_OLID1|nr:HAMP domain-containing sensor histidine kinase [Olivibacter domesticus]SEL67023.1 two-component system, OmpR family, phosphate regulon sensor histidine kinase PhoR [Olivibacter domesticus]
MKRKSIGLIIGLMLFALLGVIAMQYYFIHQSYNLKAQLFDEAVNAALNTVALKAEKKEAVDFIQAQEVKAIRNRKLQEKREAEWQAKMFVEKIKREQRQQEMEVRDLEAKLLREFPSATLIKNDFYETYMKDPKLKRLVKVDIVTAPEGFYQRNRLDVYVNKPATNPKKALDDSIRYVFIDPYMGDIGVVALPPRKNNRLDAQIRRYEQQGSILQTGALLDSFMEIATAGTSVIENLANDFEMAKKPLKNRIDLDYIREELKEEFFNRKINLPFELKITEGREDSVLFQLAALNGHFEGKNVYSTILFPNSLVRSSGKLSVGFPNKHSLILSNMGMMLGSSAALLLVLIGCFAYTIFIILRQKKISEMKTDFINNMTHEFKTPVATIMIASESLKDPEIVTDAKRVDRLANIIYDENVRLGNHIERVLNVAKIDKGDLRMDKQEVDMNVLVSAVVDSMGLQLKKRDAQVDLRIDAIQPILHGDEFHLSNVIFNLIDNAIKYSKEAPEISVRTWNSGHAIHVSVADKGIGMSRDQLSKIFDQFYRVSTGNLHDVKGFGLGLSYVQDIIKRMKGSVKVKSEKGKGTEFELTLPIVTK